MAESLHKRSKKTEARLRLGADDGLLALFGLSRGDADAASIEEGRRQVLDQGFVAEDQLPGHPADNPIFLGVEDHGERIYPAFQFETNSLQLRPMAAIANYVLRTKTPRANTWENALWWMDTSEYLRGKTPVDVLQAGDPQEVLRLQYAIYAELDPPLF